MLDVLSQFSSTCLPSNQATTLDVLLSFKPQTSDIEAPPRRNLNLSIVIDRSGSMAGTPLKHALNAARLLVEQLTAEDFLSIVIYDDDVETIFEPQLVQNKDIIYTALNRVHAGGCTNLSGGWLKGCDHVQTHYAPDKVNRVLLLTDGQANVGIRDNQILINTAQQKAQESNISTTTLGFGDHFNEDLLIGMARHGNGNFYFIQTPEDLVEVFRIELDSLSALVAQDLIVILQPQHGINIEQILNTYRCKDVQNGGIEVLLGDVYGIEPKQLAFCCEIPVLALQGEQVLFKVDYRYQVVVNERIEQSAASSELSLPFVTPPEFAQAPPSKGIQDQTNRLRIAHAKEDAAALADQGQYDSAAQKLHEMLDFLKQRILAETFEWAEEMEQLRFFIQQLEHKRYDYSTRKELKDQSYQSTFRNRQDLSLRGLSTSDAVYDLPVVSSEENGVVLQCVREAGKLRIKVISTGYNPEFNVQFPRHIREADATYLVEAVEEASNGGFYRVVGEIRLLVRPEDEQAYQQRKTSRQGGGRAARRAPPKASTAPATAADLETTDSIGKGVLVQCVQEKSKLRARVVSDGYNPDYNIRFPRSIRELGVLYVVDEVIENPKGGSYIACGKIRRLNQ